MIPYKIESLNEFVNKKYGKSKSINESDKIVVKPEWLPKSERKRFEKLNLEALQGFKGLLKFINQTVELQGDGMKPSFNKTALRTIKNQLKFQHEDHGNQNLTVESLKKHPKDLPAVDDIENEDELEEVIEGFLRDFFNELLVSVEEISKESAEEINYTDSIIKESLYSIILRDLRDLTMEKL